MVYSVGRLRRDSATSECDCSSSIVLHGPHTPFPHMMYLLMDTKHLLVHRPQGFNDQIVASSPAGPYIASSPPIENTRTERDSAPRTVPAKEHQSLFDRQEGRRLFIPLGALFLAGGWLASMVALLLFPCPCASVFTHDSTKRHVQPAIFQAMVEPNDAIEPNDVIVPEQTVDVLAPADLVGGYEFFVSTGSNSSCKVRVPIEGVKSGQRFQALVVSEALSGGPHSIPYGRWRDGFCDCCSLGAFHPLLCLTFWCPLCGLGQVLNRMKMNCVGSPTPPTEAPSLSAFKILFGVSLLNLLIQQTRTLIKSPNVTFMISLFGVFLELYAVVVTMRLRAHVREIYGIPEQRCIGCEDCCYSFWLTRCTVCHIARHLADYRKYRMGYCTDNGLRKGDPSIV
jgi:Cys-rich protein (TIGR01571 family)